MAFDASTLHSLYIHWPFCPYKCHFCPFVALAGQDQFMHQYHNALVAEIRAFAQQLKGVAEINTIFLGGGTPSTYPPELLLDMFGILKDVFHIQQGSEITLEVNPGTVTEEKVLIWHKVGINRLSIGVQSLNDKVLQGLNRRQSVQDVHRLFTLVGDRFDSLSIDLILGLPGISNEEWRQIIEQVVSWPITHISVYFLTIHENTPLYFGVAQKKVQLPPDDMMVELYAWTVEQLEENGFYRYETSNFAKAGYESRHNQVYWQRKPYKGFGLGACSFDGKQRLQNEKNLMTYITQSMSGSSVINFSETLTPEQEWLEILMLGLRQVKGMHLSEICKDLSDKQKLFINEQLEHLCGLGYLQRNDDIIRLTQSGLAVENEIIVKLSLR